MYEPCPSSSEYAEWVKDVMCKAIPVEYAEWVKDVVSKAILW